MNQITYHKSHIVYNISLLYLLFAATPTAQAQEPFQLLGSPDASTEMTVYSDFECPACRNFALVALPAIRAEFIDTGRLRLRYVFYPLAAIHPNAVASAKAAFCAGSAGRFWPYHDYLFARQPEWRGDPAPDSLWVGYAVNLGLAREAFASCLADPQTAERVNANWLEAVTAGARGTPTVVVNGKSLSELGTYQELRARLRALISES